MIKNKDISFITYFTKEFLVQGTVAIESFIKFHSDSSGFIVCLDRISVEYLRKKNIARKSKFMSLKNYLQFIGCLRNSYSPELLRSL